MTTSETLAACDRLIEAAGKATPGPWESSADDSPVADEPMYELVSDDERIAIFHEDEGDPKANSEFCALARNTAPGISAECRRLVAVVERIKKLPQEFRHHTLAPYGDHFAKAIEAALSEVPNAKSKGE